MSSFRKTANRKVSSMGLSSAELKEISLLLVVPDKSGQKNLGAAVLNYTDCSLDDDGLLFWKRRHGDFPNLKNVARHYLSISSSSVAVECIFSITGFIVNGRRSSLTRFKLNFTSFLHNKAAK